MILFDSLSKYLLSLNLCHVHSEKIYPLQAIPQLVKVAAWDGKDGELIVEPPLDDLYKEDEL